MRNLYTFTETEFFSWLDKTYPDISLSPLQYIFVMALYSIGRGGGKSFLITLLHEFDIYDASGIND
jgi:hypothetical protein